MKNKSTVYCLGELVHNEEVTKSLEEKGMVTISSIDEAPCKSTVLIRAHGEPPTTYQKAKEKQIEIIDLTCPKVLTIHKQAEEYKNKGYFVIYIAEKGHPETIGTMGFLEEAGFLVQSEEDIDKVPQKEKYAVLSQTTFSMEKFDKIVDKLKEKIDSIEINKTICDATRIRQEETKQIASNVDTMIIIGGKSSSNTKKLYEIASKNCKNAYFVQTAQDLKQIPKCEKIGIMAGASTPGHLIEEMRNKLSK